MIPALGAGGPGFNPRSGPYLVLVVGSYSTKLLMELFFVVWIEDWSSFCSVDEAIIQWNMINVLESPKRLSESM